MSSKTLVNVFMCRLYVYILIYFWNPIIDHYNFLLYSKLKNLGPTHGIGIVTNNQLACQIFCRNKYGIAIIEVMCIKSKFKKFQ